MSLKPFTSLLSEYLAVNIPKSEPVNLYEPMQYILGLGGKRLRPLMTLMATKGLRAEVDSALPAAMAVEVFHNFTLLHDDIMDNADIRRGAPTVHKKWDENTAILSGDMMMIKAYQYLESYDATSFKALTQVLSKTALEVCEGQQYDMDFETMTNVEIDDYMEMIRLKTAVLLGAALKMGAIIAKAPSDIQDRCYKMGLQLGLAFQLQDDYLDTFGDVASFGKQIGGDIIEDKKTWLYIKTKALASADDSAFLESVKDFKGSEEEKITQVKALYIKYGVDQLIRQEIDHYSNAARTLLDTLGFSKDIHQAFVALIDKLNKRNH